METNNFELHVHLEGCIWNKHIQEFWDTSEYFFPPISFYDLNSEPFGRFLAQLRFGYNFLNGIEKYVSVFNDYLEYMDNQNIVYSEIQLNYALIKTFYIDLKKLLKEFNNLLSKKNKTVRFIIDLPWQFSARSFEEIIFSNEEYKEFGVVGISMGGDENLARPKEVAEIFKKARDVNLNLLTHAGETTNEDFARAIVSELNPDRIAHGLSIADWLIDDGKKFGKIDVCLTSNQSLNLTPNLRNHPLKKWLDSDIFFTLSTDDPAIFNTTLQKEYEIGEIFFQNFDNYKSNINNHIINCSFDKDTVQRLLFSTDEM